MNSRDSVSHVSQGLVTTYLTLPAIRTGLVVTAILAVPSAGLATAVRGGSGAAGAVLGSVVVALFFTASKVVVTLVARRAREFLLPAALGTYAVKIVLLGVLAATVIDVGAVDVFSLAGAVFVGVFGWVGAELWVATHTRVPFFEPEPYSRHLRDQAVESSPAPDPTGPSGSPARDLRGRRG